MSTFSLLHPTGRSQLWISNFPRSKIFCKTLSSAYIYFYLRNSLGLIHLAFEVVIQFPRQERIVVIQHGTWGHLSTRNEAMLEKPGIWLEKLEKLEIITATPSWLQVGGAPATLRRLPAVSMCTWTGECYDRSRLALRVSPLHSQAKLLVYARG